MISRAASEAIVDRVVATGEERAEVRSKVRAGRWLEAEPDIVRARSYMARRTASLAPHGAEAIQGDTNELQPIGFLPFGADARRAVGFVELTTSMSSEQASGFLISPDLFITNAHVIVDANAAAIAAITFDRELDRVGNPRPTTSFRLAPDRCALFSPDTQLDYAIVAVGPRVTGAATVDELGFCPLLNWPDKHVVGMPVNIIQHPQGFPKMVSLRDNVLTARTDETLLYETDTQEGSSGSPVFNDGWEVVALHHWGEPHLRTTDSDGNALPKVNEGIRISAIYNDLAQRLSAGEFAEDASKLISNALRFSEVERADIRSSRVLSPPRSRHHPERSLVNRDAGAVEEIIADTAVDPDGALRISVPLEISVRVVPDVNVASVNAGLGRTAEPSRLTLTHPADRSASEAVKVDLNYSTRHGYDPSFIDHVELPLPIVAHPDRAGIVSPLHPNQPDFERGELKYQHFSVVVNGTKRMAMFTATNIDGETYLEVDRKTGQVTASEGDKWFLDPRIDAATYLGQDFYGNWSDYFDRGHLTRRSDPTWGTAATAERANADTFHFTNASPQHWRFNESAKLWQGVERYVLENGLFTAEPRRKLCVFQGPVFDPAGDYWADDVEIPAAFWKIVIWPGRDRLRAVGLVVDQSAIVTQPRHGMAPPQPLESVDVSQQRIRIPDIEQLTGLDFGEQVRAADTITDIDQPHVGEAHQLLTRLQDIRL
jgi:endonuclease G